MNQKTKTPQPKFSCGACGSSKIQGSKTRARCSSCEQELQIPNFVPEESELRTMLPLEVMIAEASRPIDMEALWESYQANMTGGDRQSRGEIRIAFPPKCPCCLGTTDSFVDEVKSWSRYSGQKRLTSTFEFSIPYCSNCKSHIVGDVITSGLQDLADLFLLFVVLIGGAYPFLEGFSAKAFYASFAILGIGIPLYLLARKIIRSMRIVRMKKSCCTDGLAIEYDSPPEGTRIHGFKVHNPRFVKHLCRANPDRVTVRLKPIKSENI